MSNNFDDLKRLREDLEALRLEIEQFIKNEEERRKQRHHEVGKCREKLTMVSNKLSRLEQKYEMIIKSPMMEIEKI